jgi:hypothetical protein
MSSDQTDNLINHINHIIASVNNADMTTVCDALCSTTQLEGHIVVLTGLFNDSTETKSFIILLSKINVENKDTEFTIRKSKNSSSRYKSLRNIKELSNISITCITETKQQHDDMFNDSKFSKAKISTNNASSEDSIQRFRENDHIQQNNINNNANNNDETKQQLNSLITAVSDLASAMQNMEQKQNARIDSIIQNIKQQQQQQTSTSTKTTNSNNNKNNNDDDATSFFDQSDDDEDVFNSKNHNNNSIFNQTKTASTPGKNQRQDNTETFQVELIINKFRDLHNIIFLKIDIGSLASREIRDIKGWIASLKHEMTSMNTNVPDVNAKHLTIDINTMTQNLEHALESLHLYGQETAIIQIENNTQLMNLHQKRLENILEMLHNAALFVLMRWEFLCCLSSKNYARSFTNGAVSSIDNFVYKRACTQAEAAKKWMDHLSRIFKTRGDPDWTEKIQRSSRSLYYEWNVVSKDYREFVGSKNSTPKQLH